MRMILKRYFLTGVLVLVPAVVSAWVLLWLIRWVGKSLQFGILPSQIPQRFMHLPALAVSAINKALQFGDTGLGLIIVLASILGAGALAHNYLGRRLLLWGEDRIRQMPVMGVIFSAVKQLIEALLSKDEKFSRVVLFEYPRKGIWAIGFVSRESSEYFNRVTGEVMLNVFMPTTPNPTTGFLMMVPKKDCRDLDLRIEEAFNIVISGGIADPGFSSERSPHELPPGD